MTTPDSQLAVRVIKVGGSLLPMPDLRQRIEELLATAAAANNLIVAGGGAQVDLVRWFDFDDSTAHVTACRMLAVTAEILGRAMETSVSPVACLELQNQSTVHVVDPSDWILGQAGVPADWSLTSDSIAAILAIETGAAELWLLKSTDSPASGIGDWSSSGFVDAYFSTYAKNIPAVSGINLRSRKTAE